MSIHVYSADYIGEPPDPICLHRDWPYVAVFNGSQTEPLTVTDDQGENVLLGTLVTLVKTIGRRPRMKLQLTGTDVRAAVIWARKPDILLNTVDWYEDAARRATGE